MHVFCVKWRTGDGTFGARAKNAQFIVFRQLLSLLVDKQLLLHKELYIHSPDTTKVTADGNGCVAAHVLLSDPVT